MGPRERSLAFQKSVACPELENSGTTPVAGLGIPQDSREAFDLLSAAGLYPRESAEKLRRMVGFSNVTVHDYQALNLDIVREIITPTWTIWPPLRGGRWRSARRSRSVALCDHLPAVRIQ